MAPPAAKPRLSLFARLPELLAPYPGRLEFAVRLALLASLTVLDVEMFRLPDPALFTYAAFFMLKPDRVGSVLLSISMVALISILVGILILLATYVMDRPVLRVASMALMSFFILFLASASKLAPVGPIIAFIVGYALDLLASAPFGEVATRGYLYIWCLAAAPAGMSIVLNLLLGPAPRRLIERDLAHRLELCSAMLRGADTRVRAAFDACLREGPAGILTWLRMAGLERTSPADDLAALAQAARSTGVLVSLIGSVATDPDRLLPEPCRRQAADLLDEMATVLRRGLYPVDIVYDPPAAGLFEEACAVAAEMAAILASFATPPPTAAPPKREAKGFLQADAFTNPAHVRYALKTTAAAMFCYLTFSVLDWPAIHTCMITCYLVSLGTAAETLERSTLRILGALLGGAAGLATLVFLMPQVTSIGMLMTIVFAATAISGWVVAGGPRIGYLGFQMAYAFFLCIIQGFSPAFQLSVGRDRVIGVLFGDLVTTVIFIRLWPVSVAARLPPLLSTFLERLADLADAASRPQRYALAAEAQTALGGLDQDLDLAAYEPASLGASRAWAMEREAIVGPAVRLPGLLVLAADQAPGQLAGVSTRLRRLAAAHAGPVAAAPEPRPAQEPEGVLADLSRQPLAELERALATVAAAQTEGAPRHAPA